MRSRESNGYALTSELRRWEDKGVLSPVLASKFSDLIGTYRSGQGSNGRTVGPNHLGIDRGPDCPHSIRDKKVIGRVQEGEGGLVVCKDSQGDEWASGVMLETPSKGMTEGWDLCGEAG